MGGNRAGVGSKGTGSSHTVQVPRAQKDSPVSYSVVATALSREGNNLGAASLHCVLLFPLVRGGCISQQEEDNAWGWLKVSLFALSKNISYFD